MAAIAVVGLAVMPAVVSAQSVSATGSASGSSTVGALEAQIQSLLSQLASLRMQLSVVLGSPNTPYMLVPAPSSTMIGSSTNPGGPICPLFNRNLSIGSQGSDVSELQSMLVQDAGFPQADVTGYFGPITAHAVASFQTMNDITSSSNATGFFGPLTRAFFGNHCLMLPGSNGGTMPSPSGTPPMPILPPPYNNGSSTMSGVTVSPSSGPVGTVVTISGLTSGNTSGTMETVLMDGLVATQDASVAADGSITFAVPQSLAPDCRPDQACPMFLELTMPRAYTISLVGQGDTVNNPMPVGVFMVTSSGSSTFIGQAQPF